MKDCEESDLYVNTTNKEAEENEFEKLIRLWTYIKVEPKHSPILSLHE